MDQEKRDRAVLVEASLERCNQTHPTTQAEAISYIQRNATREREKRGEGKGGREEVTHTVGEAGLCDRGDLLGAGAGAATAAAAPTTPTAELCGSEEDGVAVAVAAESEGLDRPKPPAIVPLSRPRLSRG